MNCLLLSQDFNFESPILRCIDINSLKLIFGKIFELNSAKYGPLIEHDLFEIMNKSSVGFIFPFFDITIQEMQGEEDNEKEILHCNFESPLKSEKLPLTWWTNK